MKGASLGWHCLAVTLAAALASCAAIAFLQRHKEIKTAFRSENAFYYSFYDQVISAPSWLAAIQAIYSDGLSEAPSTINAMRRFNVYQELLFGSLWRTCVGVTNWTPDPASFYCICVFAVHGFGVWAMEMAAPARVWSLLLAGALYYNNAGEVSHVSFMPPLRENCGIPLWFASCASILALHERGQLNRPLLWARLLLLLSVTGFLLSWQFACFALALQASALYILTLMGIASWPFALDVSLIYSASTVLSCALRLGDLWALRSIFFSLTSTLAILGYAFAGRAIAGVGGLLKLTVSFASLLLAIRQGTSLLVSLTGASPEDDAHIFEFLAFRLGLNTTSLGYHASLYEGQRSFSSPRHEDWQELLRKGLLPPALLAACLILLKLVQSFRIARTEVFHHTFVLLLACATAVPFLLMLRYRTIFFPHLVLLGSITFDRRVWPRSLAGIGLPGHCVCAVLVAGILRQGDGIAAVASPEGAHVADMALLMQWLRENTGAMDVIVSDMGLSSLIRLHAHRSIVCHPHYESAALRERCFWVNKLYGHRSLKEYHKIIRQKVTAQLPSGRTFLALDVQGCNAVNEKGRWTSHLIEQDAQHRLAWPKTCELLYLLAEDSSAPKGFSPQYISRWYAVLEVLSSPTSPGKQLHLTPQLRCDLARYLSEELKRPGDAARHFHLLPPERAPEVDTPCACALSQLWPPEHMLKAHQGALLRYRGRGDGAFGCCWYSRTLLECISSSARRSIEAGDLVSSESYHEHAASIAPSKSPTHGFLGYTRVRAGRYLAALESFQRAVSVEANRPTSTTLCGEALAWAGLGHYGRALVSLDKAGEVNPEEKCLQMRPGLQLATEDTPLPFYSEFLVAWEAFKRSPYEWRVFLESEVVERFAQRNFTGRKILFLGDPQVHFPFVMQTLGIMRHIHQCDWPAEFWLEAGEAHSLSKDQQEELASLDGQAKRIPSPHGSWRQTFWDWRIELAAHWNQRAGADKKLQMYALKTLVVLLSECEVCLFLDSDNLPLQAPQKLLGLLPGAGGLVAWPDLWDLPASAGLWAQLPSTDLPFKAQESGQLLVRKSGRQTLKALALGTLFAVRMDIFLEAIYSPSKSELVCGYGDKDAFGLAFRLVGAPMHLAADIPAVVTARDEYVGMLQLAGPEDEPVFLHGTWAKDDLLQLVQTKGALHRCDFRSQADAKNVTCKAGGRGGTSGVPLERLKCRPLRMPVLKQIKKLLAPAPG